MILVLTVGTFDPVPVRRQRQGRAAVFTRPTVCASLSAILVFAVSGCRSSPRAGQHDVVAGGAAPAIAGELSPVDNGPRTLVVYFSQGSSTKRVAEDIAALLAADIERIVERKPRTWGFFGFMAAGAAASFGRAAPIEPPARDPAAYEAVVVCTPVWAWHMAPPIRSWLRLARNRFPSMATFVTVSGDTDPGNVVASMAKEAGRQPAASAGFADQDFEAGNRPLYLAKIGSIVDRCRGPGR